MARKIDSRLILSGRLVAETPLSVGGMGGNVDADLALAVNGQGQFYIPGTSLAGPLRAWLCTRAGKKAVERLWGFQEGDQGHASFVLVEDGLVCGKDDKPLDIARSEIRDGVGIDRYSGAAADKAKYNRQILPRGSRIHFKMIVELTTATQPEVEPLLAELWGALEKGEIRFGAAKTRGLGRVALHEAKTEKQEFSNRAGLLKILSGNADSFALPIPERSQFPPSRLTFKINWKPAGPLMVKADADGLAVDMLPLVSAVDDKLTLVLPGSSIKGAFRNQAERIVRTILQQDAPDKFLEQVKVPLITNLFGAAGEKEKEKKKDEEHCPENFVPVAGLGALAIDDCYAEPRLEQGQWSAIESATDESELRAALDKTPLKTAQQAFHVAIDRWLGGAADNMLYTVLEPHGIAWEPIRLSLDLDRLPESKCDAAIACTLLVLRDFVAGRIPLGFGTNRGMGTVEVTGINLEPTEFTISNQPAKLTLSVQDQKLVIGGDALSPLNDAWQAWLKPTSTEDKEAA